MSQNVEIKSLYSGVPPYKVNAAGVLSLAAAETVAVPSDGGNCIVRTGYQISVPQGYIGLIQTKTGFSSNKKIKVEGTIEPGQTSECALVVQNPTETVSKINKGDLLAEIIFIPILAVK